MLKFFELIHNTFIYINIMLMRKTFHESNKLGALPFFCDSRYKAVIDTD